jgi:hypothetical protein
VTDWDSQSEQYWARVAGALIWEEKSGLDEFVGAASQNGNRPHILIFDRQYQAELLQKQANQWGLVAEIASHEAIAHPGIHYSNPMAIVFNLSSYEAIDIALQPLTLLIKLRYQSPHSPIFVITHGRIGDRLSFAALGGCKILDVASLDLYPVSNERPSPILFQEILRAISPSPHLPISLYDRDNALT